MRVEPLERSDARAAVALWTDVGLVRPWNDPIADYERALAGATSTVLGARADGSVVGTAMVGHDGHRGWIYYLAVAPHRQRSGLGAELLAAAEAWLREAGAVKVQLMVRHTNDEVLAFYEQHGYRDDEVRVLSRWLAAPSGGVAAPRHYD